MLTIMNLEARAARPDEAAVIELLRDDGPDQFTTSQLLAVADLFDHPDVADTRGENDGAVELRLQLVRFVLSQLAAGWTGHRNDPWTVGGIILRGSWAACIDGLEEETTQFADLARAMVYPERGAHAVLALRALALNHSKRDRYTEARLALAEAHERLIRFQAELAGERSPDVDRWRRGVLESRQQIALARSGTMDRVVEDLLHDWGFRSAQGRLASRSRSVDRSSRFLYREAYRHLVDAARSGREASSSVDDLDARSELPAQRTAASAAIVRWGTQPRIMEARARLLMLPMCSLLEDHGAAPSETQSWQDEFAYHLERFHDAYAGAAANLVRTAEVERAANGTLALQYPTEHICSLVQLRLHFGLLCPDKPLEAVRGGDDGVPDCLTSEVVETPALVRYLLEHKFDGNLICCTTADAYIDAVTTMNADYRQWLEVHRQPLGRDHKGKKRVRPSWDEHQRSCAYCETFSS